jgi:hypothetical protein
MSGGVPPRRRPDWGLRFAFAADVAALGFVAYCAFVIIFIAYCGLLTHHCARQTSHVGPALGMLAGPALALIGLACGIVLARRDARKRAIRALLGWSLLAVGACFAAMILMPPL